jgi:rhodanese-related sulfurtransferase
MVAVALAGCGSQPAQVTKIDVDQLATMLESKDFAFVNVHIPFEGEIAGTDAHIPFDEIADHLDELPAKDEKIVLYCRSGRMSDEASRELARLGYTNVYDVAGGMQAWSRSGRSLLDTAP